MKFTDSFKLNVLNPEEVQRQVESREKFKNSAIRNALESLIKNAPQKKKILERGYNVLAEQGESPDNLKQMRLEEVVRFRNIGDYNRSPKTDITDLLYITAEDMKRHPLFGKLKQDMAATGIQVDVVNDESSMDSDKTPELHLLFLQIQPPGHPLTKDTAINQSQSQSQSKAIASKPADNKKQDAGPDLNDPFAQYLRKALEIKEQAMQRSITKIVSEFGPDQRRDMILNLQDRFNARSQDLSLEAGHYKFPDDFPDIVEYNKSNVADIIGKVEHADIGMFGRNTEFANLTSRMREMGALVMASPDAAQNSIRIIFEYAHENDPELRAYLGKTGPQKGRNNGPNGQTLNLPKPDKG